MRALFGPREGLYIETDYSRFDQTILPELLALEGDFYKSCYDDPEFHRLIDAQLKTAGCHMLGIPYKRDGGRCSGDSNTSIGNCMINLFVAYVAHKKVDMPLIGLVEGDDGIFPYNEKLAEAMIETASQLGLRLKLEATLYPKFCGRYHNREWHSTSELSRLIPKIDVTHNMQLPLKELCAAKLLSLRSLEPEHYLLSPFVDEMLQQLNIPHPRLSRNQRVRARYLEAVPISLADLCEQGYTPAFLTWARDYFYRMAKLHVHSNLEWPNMREPTDQQLGWLHYN